MTTKKQEIIRVEHLEKKFNDLVVLKDISLTINKGEVVCIIGSSGSGKSTLLRCINLFETPTSGKIYIGKRASSGFGTHIYYSCDIEDFLSENINWKTEYSNENAEEKWSEHCSKRASNEEIYNSYSNF